LLWSVQLGDPASRFDVTSPIIEDDIVYVGGAQVTAALDVATGAIIWQQDLGPDWLATIHSAPVCDGTRVAYGLYSGIFMLDRATGGVLWSRAANQRETYRSPALADGVLYSAGDTFGSHRLRAFDAATGDVLWSAPVPSGNSNSAPAVTDSVVLVGSANWTLDAFARSDGQALWSFFVGDPIASSRPYSNDIATVTSSPLIAGHYAYFGADDGQLYAVDIDHGTSPWSVDLGSPVRSSPAATGNYLLTVTADGTLFAFISGDLRPAGVGEGGAPGAGLRLAVGPASPNPFRPEGKIPFVVPGAGAGERKAARLEIVDVLGRHVRTLVKGSMSPGRHEVRWDGRDGAGRNVASGVYFLRLEVGKATVADRISIVR
jgi:outer membrane protein assembly factor BamB